MRSHLTPLALSLLALAVALTDAAPSLSSFPTFQEQTPYERVRGSPYNVSYDHRAFTINGRRELLHVGSVHYPRATPEMWPELMRRSRAAGINVIETYVFWNYHEFDDFRFDFETENRDLFKFIELARDHGLFVTLRIGPYVCAEWSFGGIPVWVAAKPGMETRTYNDQWLNYMQRFLALMIVSLTGDGLMPSWGGPILMMQIENEYGHVQAEYGEDGNRYVEWMAETANAYTEGVIPWFMCEQPDAPLSVVETKNGFYADDWLAGHLGSGRGQPGAWTENFPGWFQFWGESSPHRPVQDIAYAVGRWFARGGTLQTYYVWFGGTNFGRWAGGPGFVTSYDYDAPLDEFGFPHADKYVHLARLHAAIDRFREAIVGNEVPTPVTLGAQQEAHVYGALGEAGSVAFLSNRATSEATVSFVGHEWTLSAWSVLIVDAALAPSDPDAARVFDTAVFEDAPLEKAEREIDVETVIESTLEPVGGQGTPLTDAAPLTQVPITMDETDYMWYSTSALASATRVKLELANAKDFVMVFANERFVEAARANDAGTHVFEFDIEAAGEVKLDILVQSMGFWNYGPRLETTVYDKGINGAVTFDGVDLASPDSDAVWSHRPFLEGEALAYHELPRQGNWTSDIASSIGAPLAWFDVSMKLPGNVDPSDDDHAYAVDLGSMGKGFAYFNGHHIGRFWDIRSGGTCAACDYRGSYGPEQCRTGCGEPSQRRYHVPRSWFTAAGEPNRLVLLSETGGDPREVKLIQLDAPDV